MKRADSRGEGFIVGDRLVSSVQYHLEGGNTVIVWFDRGGSDLNGRVAHSDPNRPIVAAKPGEEIVVRGQREKVVRLDVYRENRLVPAG